MNFKKWVSSNLHMHKRRDVQHTSCVQQQLRHCHLTSTNSTADGARFTCTYAHHATTLPCTCDNVNTITIPACARSTVGFTGALSCVHTCYAVGTSACMC